MAACSILSTVLFLVAFYSTTSAAQQTITLSQSGNAIPNALPAATANYSSQAANCGQVELDIFAGGNSGQLHDVFQYLTFNGGSGVNMAGNYNLTLPTSINGGVQFQIILSTLQAYQTTAAGTIGPFNASINIVSVALNGIAIVQQYAPAGNNFTFTSNQINNQSSAAANGQIVNNVSVSIEQVFTTQQNLQQNSTCLVSYAITIFSSNVTALPPTAPTSASGSSASTTNSSVPSTSSGISGGYLSSLSAGSQTTNASASASASSISAASGTSTTVVSPFSTVSASSASTSSSLSSGSSTSNVNTSSLSNNNAGDNDSSAALSGGAIAGIVIGGCCWCCLMLLLLNLGLLCGLNADAKGNDAVKKNPV